MILPYIEPYGCAYYYQRLNIRSTIAKVCAPANLVHEVCRDLCFDVICDTDVHVGRLW